MVVAFGGLFGLLFFVMKGYELLTNQYFSRNRTFMFLCIIGLAVLTSQIAPPVGWDLFRHYEEIDRIRELGAEYAWTKSRYVEYKGITTLFYLISLTPWNNLLVFFAVFTELVMIEAVLWHYRQKGLNAQTGSLCFFLFWALSNIVLAISGIRNVLAVTLTGYAIWNFHHNRRKTFVFDVIVAAFGITIHPACSIVLLLYAISYIPILPLASAVAALILPILSKYIVQYENSNVHLLKSSARLFLHYLESAVGVDMRVIIISAGFIIVSIVIVLYRIIRLHDKSRFTRFVFIYCLGTIGMLPQKLMYNRMIYGLGFPLVMLLASEMDIKNDSAYQQIHFCYKLFCFVYCAGMLAYQGLELWNAVTYYFL